MHKNNRDWTISHHPISVIIDMLTFGLQLMTGIRSTLKNRTLGMQLAQGFINGQFAAFDSFQHAPAFFNRGSFQRFGSGGISPSQSRDRSPETLCREIFTPPP